MSLAEAQSLQNEANKIIASFTLFASSTKKKYEKGHTLFSSAAYHYMLCHEYARCGYAYMEAAVCCARHLKDYMKACIYCLYAAYAYHESCEHEMSFECMKLAEKCRQFMYQEISMSLPMTHPHSSFVQQQVRRCAISKEETNLTIAYMSTVHKEKQKEMNERQQKKVKKIQKRLAKAQHKHAKSLVDPSPSKSSSPTQYAHKLEQATAAATSQHPSRARARTLAEMIDTYHKETQHATEQQLRLQTYKQQRMEAKRAAQQSDEHSPRISVSTSISLTHTPSLSHLHPPLHSQPSLTHQMSFSHLPSFIAAKIFYTSPFTFFNAAERRSRGEYVSDDEDDVDPDTASRITDSDTTRAYLSFNYRSHNDITRTPRHPNGVVSHQYRETNYTDNITASWLNLSLDLAELASQVAQTCWDESNHVLATKVFAFALENYSSLEHNRSIFSSRVPDTLHIRLCIASNHCRESLADFLSTRNDHEFGDELKARVLYERCATSYPGADQLNDHIAKYTRIPSLRLVQLISSYTVDDSQTITFLFYAGLCDLIHHMREENSNQTRHTLQRYRMISAVFATSPEIRLLRQCTGLCHLSEHAPDDAEISTTYWAQGLLTELTSLLNAYDAETGRLGKKEMQLLLCIKQHITANLKRSLPPVRF